MKRKRTKRVYFFWDYDLTEEDIKKKLKEGNEYTRIWLVGRILTSAKFEDVWKYLTIKEVLDIFPKLRMRAVIKQAWERAFTAWGYHVRPSQ